MKIVMRLLTDTIFGNGESVPGGEDMAVLVDEYGFPYYRGTTLKGVFREELIRYLTLTGKGGTEIKQMVSELLGNAGDDADALGKLIFSNLMLSADVRRKISEEMGPKMQMQIADLFTNIRTFTAIGDTGVVAKGTLRTARCVNKGLVFYGDITCSDDNKELVKKVLGMIKYIGSMRNRGFGNIIITEEAA